MIYLQLLWVYLKIGTFGFGGGYAMLSLIQHEIVDIHHWLTPQQFTDVVAISQMTPGPIGINSATYVGYAVTQSVWGAVLATVAVCLPSFFFVLLFSYFFVFQVFWLLSFHHGYSDASGDTPAYLQRLPHSYGFRK